MWGKEERGLLSLFGLVQETILAQNIQEEKKRHHGFFSISPKGESLEFWEGGGASYCLHKRNLDYAIVINSWY